MDRWQPATMPWIPRIRRTKRPQSVIEATLIPGGWTKLVNGHVALAHASSPPTAFKARDGRSLPTLRRVSGFLDGSKTCDRRPINGAD